MDEDEELRELLLSRRQHRPPPVSEAVLFGSSDEDEDDSDAAPAAVAAPAALSNKSSSEAAAGGVSGAGGVPFLTASDSDSDAVTEPPSPRPQQAPCPQQRDTAEDSDAETLEPGSPCAGLDAVPAPCTKPAHLGSAELREQLGEADIVRVDPRGIAGVEIDLLRGEDECRVYWDKREYPLIAREKAVFDDLATSSGHSVEDLALSNLEQLQRKPPPFGILPARINRFLHSFQKQGVTFLYRLYERGRGGLLADAMGLGKTVQMICFLGTAFAVWDKPREGLESARILILAPSSLKQNWLREIQVWTPFRVAIFSNDTKSNIRTAIAKNELDIVIVGETAFRDSWSNAVDTEKSFFSLIKWNVLVIDEIQAAKNDTTGMFQAIQSLPVPVKYGMTGTLIQNKLSELWNIMSLLVGSTNMWPSKSYFKNSFVVPIKKGSSLDSTEFQKAEAKRAISKMRSLLEKHIMRRPKSVIEGQIPGKTDSTVFMRMRRDSLQGRMWNKFINSYDAYMSRNSLQPCSCGSGNMSKICCHGYPGTPENLAKAPLWKIAHPDGEPCRKCPNCINFRLMYVGLQIARHALLLVPDDNDEKILDRQQVKDRIALATYYSDGEYNDRVPVKKLEMEPGLSCKLDIALKLLHSFSEEKHKTIIFYENLRLGGILMRWATNNGFTYQHIDGKVAAATRQGNVDKFQDAKGLSTLFFVSKRTGGTGLNITSADRVIIFEPCWNPTLDLQAQDRAHRIGQQRIVKVFRLVVKDSIEDYQLRTAIAKHQLSNAVLDNTEESWHFKGKDLGNMNAMLRRGPLYAEDNGQESVPFFVEESSTQKSTQNEDDVDDDENFVLGHDVLLELPLGSIEVDVDPDELNFGDEDCETIGDGSRQRYRDHRDGSNNIIASADRGEPVHDISETQEEDAMLHLYNADSRLIVSSTVPKHRLVRQLVGNANAATGGINNRHGADGVDYTMNPILSQEAGSKEEIVKASTEFDQTLAYGDSEAAGPGRLKRRQNGLENNSLKKRSRELPLEDHLRDKHFFDDDDSPRDVSPRVQVVNRKLRSNASRKQESTREQKSMQKVAMKGSNSSAKTKAAKMPVAKTKSRFGARAQVRR